MSGFIFIPLYPIFMDIILPLNETRHRQQMFRLKFFIDEEEYFYLIYFYIVWCTFATVMIAVTIDSLYIQLVHHDCALFAVCGQNIITATRSTDVGINETYTERFRQCLNMHKNALQLFEMLDVSSRRSYFFQILLTMVGMTVTAVQAVVNLHRPEEAIRIGLFLVGQQFHLLIITLPGQVITDHSFELTNDIYCSTWYKVPVKIQKILLTMHMRSSKPCKLTAGGIYEMNIENFGITFKTCVSYFTVLLSVHAYTYVFNNIHMLIKQATVYSICITKHFHEINLSLDYIAFQRYGKQYHRVFEISYYKILKKYLQLVGLNPQGKERFGDFSIVVALISIASIFVPTILEFYASLCARNIDAALECVPHLAACAASICKLLNIYIYRKNFNKLFNFIEKEWGQLKLNNELHILEKVLMQGNKMGQLYRSKISQQYPNTCLFLFLGTLMSFMILFLVVPLISPIMDIIHPLNETRSRQQLLRVNYMIFDQNDYFFYVYIQLAWGAVIVVMTVIAADWLYILIIHHSSGLFAVCGYKVQKATRQSDSDDEIASYKYKVEQFRDCVIMHNEAIEFYNLLNESNQKSYLIQVGINMMGMSVTAVQTVVNFDRPAEALRAALFHGANQFHLFVLSLPGQVLLDHCNEFAKQIYSSTWYNMPLKVQKMLYIMQIRCRNPCTLTAGGLYEMNMENFGITFKTCMSYFTMIMSFKG
ncbi:uncharacterized protein LOC122529551 [Frieseomelitta varia]|uniref:uncharacterized protein LOC122529551 n=1 Tax=Frieseomelitta varia TaxID=561572 RepID=UPI001CB67C39|nr:uncharacterized protein LOC122529551 [Frieseomelitta varia]